MNIFYFHSDLCKSANLNTEALIYNTMAETLDKIGKEATLKAIEAHINNCTHGCESWSRLFFLEAYSLLSLTQ